MTSPQTMLNFIAIRDQRLMRRVNRWQPPRWIRLWMICATRGGDGWLWYAMGLIILLYGGPSVSWQSDVPQSQPGSASWYSSN